MKRSFREFAAKVPERGKIVANIDDRNTMDALAPLGRELFTFGLTDKADVYARNIHRVGANSEFDIYCHGKLFTSVTLHIPGIHNVKNALAATAACICLGVRPNAVKYGLAGFNGAGRRFEFKGKFNGADVYDDYAHHPGELKALLDAVEPLGYKRTILVFQPHTYTRTKAFLPQFAEALSLADKVILADIYAARETDTLGISSEDIVKLLKEKGKEAWYLPTFDEIEKFVMEHCTQGDLLITMGAGDVVNVGENLLAK